MHIIKISPVSFKIILSKEDLQRNGVENIFEHAEYSGDFFAKIIEKTNALYGNPFKSGSVDADFFASKDGGGELFISKKSCFSYLFRTKSLDNLISLCKQLSLGLRPQSSTLYFDDGIYCLLTEYDFKDEILVSRIKEYGDFRASGIFEKWLLEEHGKLLISGNAVQSICRNFRST